MNKMLILERIKILYVSLQFCSTHNKTFTAGERICINQERLQWLHILTNPESEPRPISMQVESKIENITQRIAMGDYNISQDDPLLGELLTTNYLIDGTE
jgi:hypothetical protein